MEKNKEKGYLLGAKNKFIDMESPDKNILKCYTSRGNMVFPVGVGEIWMENRERGMCVCVCVKKEQKRKVGFKFRV